MTNFTVPEKENVSELNQKLFDALQSALGMVPNLFAVMAYSQNGLSRYLTFQNSKTSLNNKEKEAVNLIVSEINQCKYCLSAHTFIGKMNGFSEEEIIRIRRGNSSNKKLDALIKLTQSIVQNKGNIENTILKAFYNQGYNNENLIDVILQAGEEIISNYLHNLTQIPVDFPLAPELAEVA